MDALMLLIIVGILAVFIAGAAIGVDSRDGMPDDHQRRLPEGI